MNMANGYIGKIARINLTTGEVNIEKPDDLFYRTYIGGKGFIAYYLLKEVPADADPLGEDNKLIFACGALTGVPAAGMPRFSAGAKSPLTGAFGQSDAGGFWGPELKKAGYDGLIIEGKSPTPVYLYINDDEIRIKDAKNLWGLDTGEAQEAIRRENGGGSIKIAQIGIGGENLVRYACIINELKHANGRNGMGAVMGSKKLKAIAVKGSGKIPFADENKIKSISKKFLEIYMDNPLSRGLYEYGTAGGVAGQNAAGLLPTRNFINGEFGGANNIGGETMADTILKKREGCYSCAIRCKRAVEVQEEGLSVDSRFGGPEYETLAAFGSLCEIDDLKIIAKANELCNRYGLDTISTGCSIAFAMECTSRGILNKEFFEGMEVTFGNSSVVLPMIEKIARREGFGDILAEGTKAAAKRIGIGAQDILLTVKGQELPMHDPRGKTGVGIGYAVSESGADHMRAGHDTLFSKEGFSLDSVKPLGILEPVDVYDLSSKKVRNFIYLHDWWSFFDMAGICDFGPAPRGAMSVNDVVELLQAATGWDISLWEIMKAGERSINMARYFNIKAGLKKSDDMLPERLFAPLKNGRQKGTSINKDEFTRAILLYYSMMGWNEDGIPLRSKLGELNLDWVEI